MQSISQSQVNKAGQVWRRHLRGDPRATAADAQQALEVIEAFRAQHAAPLVSVNNSLRGYLRTEGCPVEVTQRLKRMSTILDKVGRESTLALGKMQDIGGVRAVVETVDQVRAVEARIKKNRQVVRSSDYITSPRDSGYRGVHVVVTAGPDHRQIEIQLRTTYMHDWAITVERLSSRRGENLKRDGDTPIQRLMAAISEAMALEEAGRAPSEELLSRLEHLRAVALPVPDEER